VVPAAGGGAGTATYVMGKLEGVEPKDLQTVYGATELAVIQLELRIMEKSKDAMSAAIELRDTEGRKITINLQTAGEGATKISIQVSSSEDERKSRIIYQKIRENLQKK
jgi:hypothetical protein